MTLVVQLVRKSEEKAEDFGEQWENLIFQLLSLQGLALSTLKVNIHLWSPVSCAFIPWPAPWGREFGRRFFEELWNHRIES